MRTKQLSEDVLAVLSRVTIRDCKVYLAPGQLDRKLYLAVNEVLTHLGGKWNRGAKAHVFDQDPTDALDQVMLEGEIVPPKSYGYFPTPAELADLLVMEAQVYTGMKVLEPSAGTGAIADALVRRFCQRAKDLLCFDILQQNVDKLIEKGYASAICEDFMQVPAGAFFDRVIMNPPFERQQDIDHVLHAFDFLKPGGRLVSVMSAGVLFRENKKTVAFREFVATQGGTATRLPPDSFVESGTHVNTCYIVMDKEG